MSTGRITSLLKATLAQDEAFGLFSEMTNDVMLLLDLDGRIQHANSEFLRIFKVDESAIRGKDCVELKLCPDGEEHHQLLQTIQESGSVDKVEVGFQDSEGIAHHCIVNARTVETEGGTRILMVGRILDEIDALQAQLFHAQKMEEVGRLTGAVAHDLNNILTVILGNISYAELLTSANLASIEDLVRIRNEVKLATERAVGVTGQLLAFSRKQFMEVKVLDMRSMLEEAGRMILHLMPENVSFDLELSDRPVKNVSADPMLIQQVLLNLSVNAVHAMPRGGSLRMRLLMTSVEEDISCTVCNEFLKGEYVVVQVIDEGVGIPEEMLRKIFDPFFTTKEAGKGTGLGLSTVANIMLRHKGHLHVDSTPGEGSVFSIYLPAVDGDAAEVRRPIGPGEEVPKGSERVLVVDDDINIRRLMTNLLRSRGYDVEAISDGQEVIRRCTADGCDYDLLITDVMMPGTNGLQIAASVRENNPKIRILCISGYIESTELMDEVEEKRYPLLVKPFNSMQLLLKVRDVLESPIES